MQARTQEQQQEQMLTVTEVVDLLRVGRTSVNSWLWDGSLKSIKLGRRRLVRRSDLEQFIRDHEYGAEEK